MRLKYLFSILVLLLLTILGLLLYQLSHQNPVAIYIAEGLIFVTLIYLIYFYQKVIRPYRTISNGMELLKEQDFSNTLRTVGQIEADQIVDVFNRMMQQLKDVRLHVREQNHFFDLLVKVSPMGVIIFNFDGYIASCNDAALRMLEENDFEKLKGRKLESLDMPLAKAIAHIPRNSSATIRIGDSRIFKCSNLSFIDHGFTHPFTLIESLTDEVMSAEKKAYEKVIRMIAHEVNNTTAGITSTLDSVQAALTEMCNTDDLRDVIAVCVERCYSMSRFITNFADVVKIPEPILQQSDLNKEVSNCKIFMENLCADRHITLHTHLSEAPIIVDIDKALFEQVLINIVKNAAESINREGDIYITTTGEPIILEIADNGQGINKDTEEKLFTPFFSTKPNGQGIGLVFIQEVLKRHRCTFSLRTYNDGLTRFKIMFSKSHSK